MQNENDLPDWLSEIIKPPRKRKSNVKDIQVVFPKLNEKREQHQSPSIVDEKRIRVHPSWMRKVYVKSWNEMMDPTLDALRMDELIGRIIDLESPKWYFLKSEKKINHKRRIAYWKIILVELKKHIQHDEKNVYARHNAAVLNFLILNYEEAVAEMSQLLNLCFHPLLLKTAAHFYIHLKKLPQASSILLHLINRFNSDQIDYHVLYLVQHLISEMIASSNDDSLIRFRASSIKFIVENQRNNQLYQLWKEYWRVDTTVSVVTEITTEEEIVDNCKLILKQILQKQSEPEQENENKNQFSFFGFYQTIKKYFRRNPTIGFVVKILAIGISMLGLSIFGKLILSLISKKHSTGQPQNQSFLFPDSPRMVNDKVDYHPAFTSEDDEIIKKREELTKAVYAVPKQDFDTATTLLEEIKAKSRETMHKKLQKVPRKEPEIISMHGGRDISGNNYPTRKVNDNIQEFPSDTRIGNRQMPNRFNERFSSRNHQPTPRLNSRRTSNMY